MKTFHLANTDLTVPAVVAGMMRIKDLSDAEVRGLFDAALDVGINFFDHADIYGGGSHQCEQRFAEALRLSPSQREQIVLQTKAGIIIGPDVTTFDFSHDHIIEAVDGSLRALRTDYIDILLLHRPDALVEPEEVAQAFDELQAAGKVRHFGVSNHTPDQIELLKRCVTQPLVANQVQISLTHSPAIAQGLAVNMSWTEQSTSRDNGLVDYCRLHDITLQAWSPYQNPDWSGTFLGNDDQPELNAALARIGAQYGVTAMGAATAWLTRHPANIQVVTGTTQPSRLREAAAGSDVVLTKPQWYELFQLAGHIIP